MSVGVAGVESEAAAVPHAAPSPERTCKKREEKVLAELYIYTYIYK